MSIQNRWRVTGYQGDPIFLCHNFDWNKGQKIDIFIKVSSCDLTTPSHTTF